LNARSDDGGWPVLEWCQVAEALRRQTFQVLLEDSCGTAFLVAQGIEQNSRMRHYAIATAWHVIEDLFAHHELILFRHWDSLGIKGETENVATARLGPPEFDLGLLFLRTADDLLKPEEMMPVRGLKTFPSLGEDLGWYGHPASLGNEPIFCRGSLACFKTDPHCYLIDGIAYPGMSGGAVADKRGWVIGLISRWWQDAVLPDVPGMVQAAPSAMVRHVLEDRMGATILDPFTPNAPG
jgi:hypothetical protein